MPPYGREVSDVLRATAPPPAPVHEKMGIPEGPSAFFLRTVTVGGAAFETSLFFSEKNVFRYFLDSAFCGRLRLLDGDPKLWGAEIVYNLKPMIYGIIISQLFPFFT